MTKWSIFLFISVTYPSQGFTSGQEKSQPLVNLKHVFEPGEIIYGYELAIVIIGTLVGILVNALLSECFLAWSTVQLANAI